MVAGQRQAIDSAPVKANASMDSLLLKQSADSLKMHLVPVEGENSPTTEESNQNDSRKPEQFLSAPAHQLRKLEKHQDHLRDSPKGLGGHHEKARLVSNKTHYSLELQQFTGGFFRQLIFFVGSSFQIGMVSDNPMQNASFAGYTRFLYIQIQLI